MSIHTLHDLCYAYAVADPVREALFALQDRITELEAQRQWVGLTDDEIAELYMSNTDRPIKGYWEFARAIEAKLKERNND